jgi:Flp pilus assembly pilin Flp
MTGSVTVSEIALPQAFNVTGGGYYCEDQPGVVVGLSGSQFGVEYTLMPGNVTVIGNGGPISFGIQSVGNYSVSATNAGTGCSSNMIGSAIVVVAPKPVLIVTDPAAVCSPGTVDLTVPAITAGSTLYGAALTYWTNPAATLPLANPTMAGAGTYYILATSTIGCTDIKPVTVTVNPKPFLVTNPQSACSPYKVDLTNQSVTSGSTLYGALLTYWTNAAATIPLANPVSVGAGTYYIKATTAAGCFDIQPVTVTIHPLPSVFPGIGSGSYCAGGTGLVVGIAGSQIGVNYTLFLGLNIMSATIPGTGSAISFGVQTLEGTYWVFAENTTTHCYNRMYNCVHISIDPLLPVGVTVTASGSMLNVGTAVTLTAFPVNGGSSPVYEWKVNGLTVGSNQNTYTYMPLNGDEVQCILTSNASCVSGNPAASNIIVMQVNGVSANIIVAGNIVSGQSKCYNSTQTITVAGNGNPFNVQSGGSVTLIAGNNIIYLPGATVHEGGYMHGYITTNNEYCGQQVPSIPSIVSGEQDSSPLESRQTFTIYPNPTSGNFTIEQRSGVAYGKVKVEVYGMRGERLIQSELFDGKSHEVSVSGFPTGIYFVKVAADGYIESFKLVKQP